MIGYKIRKLRNEKGISQEYLADRLNISQATLSNIESGKTKPDIDVLKGICEEFSIEIIDLIDSNKTFHQENGDQVVGYVAETQNFYLPEKLIEQFEQRIKEKDELIAFLKKKLEQYEK